MSPEKPTDGKGEDAAPEGWLRSAPGISMPKGGGAIRGIGEKFSANPVTGTGSMAVPIATSPGRGGFGPQLSLGYDSGSGNGTFGFGWNLALPCIARKTEKGLPRYADAQDSDVFLLSGAEDLVPVYRQDNDGSWIADHPGFDSDPVGHWVRDPSGRLIVHEDELDGYRVCRYRPRVEGLFARIERWSKTGDAADVHWRSISKDNVLTLYGLDVGSRIADPLDRTRIFTWLICESRDDKGNAVLYRYRAEDGQGVALGQAHERNRGPQDDARRTANRYIKRILYGNRTPLLEDAGRRPHFLDQVAIDRQIAEAGWMFEVVFDYGDHDAALPRPGDDQATSAPGQPKYPWPRRQDPFSTYRAGFEIRTSRLCRRVLMFHHFPGAAGVERDCLVRSTDFVHSADADPANARKPVYTLLRSVTQSGYRRKDGGYDRRDLPPVQFTYTEPIVQETVERVDSESLDNLPMGVDGSVYRWIDLHGEGVSGILTEQAGAWFYKRNLSPIPEKPADGPERMLARFAPLETVACKPEVALGSGAELMDLSGDGLPDVVIMDGPMPGLYEHDGEVERWLPFRAFVSRPNREWRDPNLKFVDLDGDGHADALITEDDALVWHPSLASKGFDTERRVAQSFDEELGPRVVFADGTQSIHMADLSGDGLDDILRIRNGEVCYWPNLGHGRFGAKVTMDNSPWFDNADLFDQRRIRLADIDGSGTADIIYLHRDGVRLYFNQSGNAWSEPHQLDVFPRIDDVASIMPADLLGNGTACLVWSSPLPADAGRQMRYVNLMGERKPHLLVGIVNNLGAETRIDYAASTRFYLQDKYDGKPWLTRLPFPVHVVDRVETWDRISRNRFVTRYAYHHGHFDGVEREFRGFGMVEQTDSEEFAAFDGGELTAMPTNGDPASHVPPILTRTWFHTGLYVGRDHVSDFFAGHLNAGGVAAYYREPGLDDAHAKAQRLPDTAMPAGLTPDEEREACRALKGSMLRQEIYALDASDKAGIPYTVVEQNFTIEALQAQAGNLHAVFFVHPRETLACHYERSAGDPRISHALTLEVDAFGNVLRSLAIGYGRREASTDPSLTAEDQYKQTRRNADGTRRPLITYTLSRHAEGDPALEAAAAGHHRAPLPAESRTYELTGFEPEGSAARFSFDEWARGGFDALESALELSYELTADDARRSKRVIEHVRALYRQDDLSALSPLFDVESLALPGEAYRLALTRPLVAQVFARPRPGQPDEALLPDPAAVLEGQAGNAGGYIDLDGDGRWWIPSGRQYFYPDDVAPATELAEARAHFFLPRRYRDAFGHDTFVDFDNDDLLMRETRDALGNRMTVDANDYRVLQPRLVSDPNRNQTEVAFDTLGLVVATCVMGKPTDAPRQGDALPADFAADPPQALLDPFVDKPRVAADVPGVGIASQAARDLLGTATTRIVYDLTRYMRLGEPPFAATIVRETHVSDLPRGAASRLQVSFSYSDGFGREIQKKIQAESGPVPQRDAAGAIVVAVNGLPVMTAADATPRWVGSGWTVFNNKGKPVRQYEPFFTDTHSFEFDVRIGVSPLLFYDPAERVVATLHPNRSYEKVVFDAWQQTTWDVNDTCAPWVPPAGDPRAAQTGDPRTDPDIAGYMARYFKALSVDPLRPWQTWNAQRIGNALGADECNAAKRAAAHAATPTTAHFDALGRTFLTVARNRIACAGHPLDARPDEEFRTRVELDIEGNQREVRDERRLPDADNLPLGPLEQRVVMRYAYDMLGNRLHQASMEAGARWMLGDAAGKPIRAWDSRGHAVTTTYDPLRRPIEQRVQGMFADADPLQPNSDPRTRAPAGAPGLLVDRIEYGEPPLPASAADEEQAQRLNLRTRLYRHFDSAGVVTHARLDVDGHPTEAFDFKGNLLHVTRQLVSDYKAIPDWGAAAAPRLDTETFEGSTCYDALNRPVQSIAPHSSRTRPGHPNKFNVVQPAFNEANLLERVDVWLERGVEPPAWIDTAVDVPSSAGVANIDYDAKGQRQRIDFRNGASTVYEHDPFTFRLTQMLTRRGAAAFPGDDPVPPTAAWPGKQLQNLHYTYDPAGNITHIQDDAQQAIYFRKQRVEPSNDYIYDACYRLIQADGREHLGQARSGERFAPTSPDAFNAFHTRLDHPGNGNAMGTYTERYVYDAVGNFLQMQHRGTDPANAGWTRSYAYGESSLVEAARQSNRLSRTTLNPAGNAPQPETYLHDVHGNMLRMPHLGGGQPGPNMHWDYKDQLCQADLGGGGTAYYVYDASGQRVRKVWEKAPGLIEERLYLGGFEIFRRHGGPVGDDTATLERETLHVMDDKQRIALVEMRTLGDEPTVPQRLIRYQFGNYLGSSSLELDERAQVISYEEYAPYGSSTYQAVRSQTETGKRYRYTGKERDEESGFSYHGARYYVPWLAKWTSCDPLGLMDSNDLYQYVADSPIRHSDPTGGGMFDRVKGFVSNKVDRALAAVRPGGTVFEATDSAFKPNEHSVSAAVLNNMSKRGEELVQGTVRDLKGTANDYAGLAYYSTHTTEYGSNQKVIAALDRQARAPLNRVVGMTKGFVDQLEKVGKGAGDIAYYSAHRTEHGADAKIANAVTDVVLDGPQIVLTVADGIDIAGKVGSAVPKGNIPHKNSFSSDAPNHVYEIHDATTRRPHKSGVSAQPLNVDGTSPRANLQVNELNRQHPSAPGQPPRFSHIVWAKDVPRRVALSLEQHAANAYKNTFGTRAPGMEFPRPNKMYGPGAFIDPKTRRWQNRNVP